MIAYSEKDDRLSIRVLVVPRAARSEIVGAHNGALRVRIAAPPVEGAANEELVRLLAKTFRITRGAIEIKSGRTAKLKTVYMAGVTSEILESVLSREEGHKA